MNKNGVNYKIEKYTFKLKNAQNRNDADMYQDKLRHYHGLNKKMAGGNGEKHDNIMGDSSKHAEIPKDIHHEEKHAETAKINHPIGTDSITMPKVPEIFNVSAELSEKFAKQNESFAQKIREIGAAQEIDNKDLEQNLLNLEKQLKIDSETNKRNENKFKQSCADNQAYNAQFEHITGEINKLTRGECKVGAISIDTDAFNKKYLNPENVIQDFKCGNNQQQEHKAEEHTEPTKSETASQTGGIWNIFG